MEDLLNHLIEAVNLKKALSNQMLEVTLHQKESLKEKNVEKFEQYMHVRENLISEIDYIDSNILSVIHELKIKHGIENLKDIESNSIVSKFLDTEEGIRSKIREIIDLDELNRKDANTIMESIRKELKTVKVSMKVHNVYKQSDLSFGLLDQKS